MPISENRKKEVQEALKAAKQMSDEVMGCARDIREHPGHYLLIIELTKLMLRKKEV
jgi:hypothetical protein